MNKDGDVLKFCSEDCGCTWRTVSVICFLEKGPKVGTEESVCTRCRFYSCQIKQWSKAKDVKELIKNRKATVSSVTFCSNIIDVSEWYTMHWILRSISKRLGKRIITYTTDEEKAYYILHIAYCILHFAFCICIAPHSTNHCFSLFLTQKPLIFS